MNSPDSFDEATRTILTQFLAARLRSAEASLHAATELQDPHVLQEAATNFTRVAELVWAYQAPESSSPEQAHQGRRLILWLRQQSFFNFGRLQHLPLLAGDEALQLSRLANFFAALPSPDVPAELQLRQREDRFVVRLSGWHLPRAYRELFSRRHPLSWLVRHLNLDNFEAWMFFEQLRQAGVEPYFTRRSPKQFYLTWRVARQLSLPLPA